MKKLSAIIAAVLVIATVFAAIPVNAETVNEKVLKYTPKLDGKLDAAYLQSFYVNHEWPSERSSENYWGNGKFAFTDLEKNEDGSYKEGSVGYNTAYGWDLKASTYFLWDDDNIYIAVMVTDDDYGCIDDAHYEMACLETGNLGPWLQDAINVLLSWQGLNFTIRADRAGRYASVFREPNYGEQVWCDMYSWIEHQKNKEAGYFATAETGSGYLIELKVPVSEDIKPKVLKDNGKFNFGITIVDAGANSPYGLNQALIPNEIFEEGYQLEDFMSHNDCLSSVDNSAKQRVVLSSEAPVIDESAADENAGADNGVENTTPSDNQTQTGTNTPAANTGDVGIVAAATALVAGACLVFIKKRK